MCCFSDFLLWFAISQIFPHSPPIGEDCKGKHKKRGIKTYSPYYLTKNRCRLIGPWYLSGYVQGRQIQDLGSGELFCVPTAEFSLRDTSKSRKHNNRLFWAFCN